MNLRAIVTSTDLRVRVGFADGWSVIVDRVYYVGSEAVASKPIYRKSCEDFSSAHSARRSMAEGAALMVLENESTMEQPFLPEEVVPPSALVSLN